MSILQSMNQVTRMAKESGKLCYLYKSQTGFLASFEYWPDWLFKAYPGGRRILSMAGKKLVSEVMPEKQ